MALACAAGGAAAQRVRVCATARAWRNAAAVEAAACTAHGAGSQLHTAARVGRPLLQRRGRRWRVL